jgi:hypothetical protein
MAYDRASETCRDCKNIIYAGLEQLAKARRQKTPSAAYTIVDGLVEEVTRIQGYGDTMREKAALYAPSADDPASGDTKEYRKFIDLAAKYDEMAVTAQMRMLELAAKAANNEQLSIDRQMHIEAMFNGRLPNKGEKSAALIASEDDAVRKVNDRNAILRAAATQARDAEYRTLPKDRGE